MNPDRLTPIVDPAGDKRASEIAEQNCVAGRLSARAVLEERSKRLREEARRIDTLLRALPVELPSEADEALWSLAVQASRI